MNLDYNKQDAIQKPISPTTVAALEYNQIAGSLMDIQNAAGLTADANDLTQLTTAINKLGATAAMPSSTYDALTLGASGSSYTATSNGYVYLQGQSSIADGIIQVASNGLAAMNRSYEKYSISVILPVLKGQSFVVYYDGTLSNVTFKFYYAEGSKSEAN